MVRVSKNIGHMFECRAGFRPPRQILVVSLSLSTEITVTNSSLATALLSHIFGFVNHELFS
jgi:hypothetical protein